MNTKDFYDKLMKLKRMESVLYKSLYADNISFDKAEEIRKQLREVKKKKDLLNFKKELFDKAKKV